MKSTQSTSPQDNTNAVDSSNGSPKVPPLRIVFSTTSASGSIGTNAANVDHTYSSSGDSTATSTAAEETSAVKSRKRQKTGNSDVTTSCSSSSTTGRGSNPSQTTVSSTPSVGTKKHHHHHHHHHPHHRTSSSCSSSSSSSGSKKKPSSSSSESEEDMNAEHSSEINEATAAGNGMTSPKSSCPSNAPSSSNAVSSKPTSPVSTQSEPKVPSLRIVISSSGSTSGSTSATSSISQSNSDMNKVSSSITSANQTLSSTKNLPYVVSSSTTAADAGEEAVTSEYDTSGSSGVSTSAGVSTSGRVTRSSQRAAQQQQQKGDADNDRHATSPTSTSSGKRDPSAKETIEYNQGSGAAGSGIGSGTVKDEKTESKDQTPRKRKLRNKQQSLNQQGSKQAGEQDEDNESTSSSTSSGVGGVANCGNAGATSTEKESKSGKEFQMPSYNCYHMYSNIRKQIDKRRRQMFPVQPKAPQGFKDYLLNKGSYLLEGKVCLPDTPGNGRNIPVMTPPPATLKPGTGLHSLYIDQERTRQKLRLRHLIEREKLQLSTEQEVLRVHGRAALAMANQSLPFSVCTILKDEEIYNTIDSESDSTSSETVTNNGSSSGVSSSRNEYQRTTYTTSASTANSATDLVTLTGNAGGPGARSRYNGRLFISWLQDVDDKWEKIKSETISRQKRESESLHAIQKLEWEWKMKEIGACDVKCSPLIDDSLVPAVQVSEDFDLLPV